MYETQSTLPGASPYGGHSPLNKKLVHLSQTFYIYLNHCFIISSLVVFIQTGKVEV